MYIIVYMYTCIYFYLYVYILVCINIYMFIYIFKRTLTHARTYCAYNLQNIANLWQQN